MAAADAAQVEFLALGDALKRCPGEMFEAHGHPAVLLDQATGPSVRVWGWWSTTDQPLPCLLWCSERGWFASVVGPDASGSPGYELSYWSHRIKLLDLALANAFGPHPSLGLLELDLVLGTRPPAIRTALLWGIVRLRAAHQRAGQNLPRSHADETRAAAGVVDQELARHALVPTVFKKRITLGATR